MEREKEKEGRKRMKGEWVGTFSKGGFRLFPAHRYTGDGSTVACQISISGRTIVSDVFQVAQW